MPLRAFHRWEAILSGLRPAESSGKPGDRGRSSRQLDPGCDKLLRMIYREDRNEVAVLRMEHGKVSALDLEMLLEFRSRLDELQREPRRAVILTGTGSSFSAGVDLYRLLEGGREYLDRFLPALDAALRQLYEFPRPVVAAVNGHAIAGGCIIACACDFRLMSAGRIGVTELLVGVPFPALPLEIIRASVAPQHFQSILYTGRTYTPPEALHVGLVDEVVQDEALLDRACDVARRLAAISPRAFEITKSQIRRYGRDLDAAILETWTCPETRAAIEAYLEKTIRRKTP